ncbi:glycosyltransferase family 2 protein [Williamsia herbipolensis]|uniref:glycosyltransferase family 2 protein n=1 Tax=Williamsia herbipolensis TaxID=1603258 RepID=UPI0008263403|nr:glycosyltransferase family 2 protein [Williamsia herbipolensis]
MNRRLLVCVPVFGQIEYTHALIGDLDREDVDFVIIDNRGDYRPLGGERVVTPGTNLGQAGGSNLGFRTAFSEGYQNAMTLNNDTRLSPGYFDGLLDPRLPDDAGAVCAVYDDRGAHPALLSEHTGDAADYAPRDVYRDLKVVDGTGLLLTREAFIRIGELDERSFGRFAWGADLDLCIRLRAVGMSVVATERSFLNHFGRKTVSAEIGRSRYGFRGLVGMSRGLTRVHGRGWTHQTNTTSFERYDLDTHELLGTDTPRRLLEVTKPAA